MVVSKMLFCYICFFVIFCAFLQSRTSFFSLSLLFFFVFICSVFFFFLQLYLFLLFFLSIYAGAVLVLFLFVFMFLSAEPIFAFDSTTNVEGGVALLFLFIGHIFLAYSGIVLDSPLVFLGSSPFFNQTAISFFSQKLYIDFLFVFLLFGYIFFLVLIGISDLKSVK